MNITHDEAVERAIRCVRHFKNGRMTCGDLMASIKIALGATNEEADLVLEEVMCHPSIAIGDDGSLMYLQEVDLPGDMSIKLREVGGMLASALARIDQVLAAYNDRNPGVRTKKKHEN